MENSKTRNGISSVGDPAIAQLVRSAGPRCPKAEDAAGLMRRSNGLCSSSNIISFRDSGIRQNPLVVRIVGMDKYFEICVL